MIRRLRSNPFDDAILFPNSLRSALVARLAGARRRIGYDRDARGWLLTDRLQAPRIGRAYKPHPMLDYYAALASAAGCPVDDNRMELFSTPRDESALDARLPHDDRPLVVLNPGASYGPAKCWPAERYAELADRLADTYGCRVVATCGPAERDIAERLRAAANHPLTIFQDPPLGLGPLKALVRRAQLMVTNDTGPRHFANAFGTPVVTVFGPTDPRWTETDVATERSLMVKVHCGPCMKRTCPLDHRCMKWVSTEMVLASASELIKERAAQTK
jgi:heptosyltransferase-2